MEETHFENIKKKNIISAAMSGLSYYHQVKATMHEHICIYGQTIQFMYDMDCHKEI